MLFYLGFNAVAEFLVKDGGDVAEVHFHPSKETNHRGTEGTEGTEGRNTEER